MATHDEILFGRIAVLSKFVTEEQIDECIRIQEQRLRENAENHVHLGTILVEKGYLSEREKRAILQVQKENLQRREAGTNAKRQERIFGYLVMRLGYCTEQQVYECVREQARLMRLNLFFRLGEVFVSKQYLSFEQVEEILALQGKFIVTCPGCKTKFNVVRYQAGSKVKCPECGTIIEVPDVLGEIEKEKDEAVSEQHKSGQKSEEQTQEMQLGTSETEAAPEDTEEIVIGEADEESASDDVASSAESGAGNDVEGSAENNLPPDSENTSEQTEEQSSLSEHENQTNDLTEAKKEAAQPEETETPTESQE